MLSIEAELEGEGEAKNLYGSIPDYKLRESLFADIFYPTSNLASCLTI